MKPKLQLGGEKENGNTSTRSSAQTMQHSPVAAFENEAIVTFVTPVKYNIPSVFIPLLLPSPFYSTQQSHTITFAISFTFSKFSLFFSK